MCNTNKNPISEYFAEIFSMEHMEEFFSTLNEKQRDQLSIFLMGFSQGVENDYLGVFDVEYLRSKKLTDEIMNTLGLCVKSFKLVDFTFAVVYPNPENKAEFENAKEHEQEHE